MDFALFIMIWRMHACELRFFLDLMLGWKNQPGLIFHSAGLGPVSTLEFCIFEFAYLMQHLIIPGAGYKQSRAAPESGYARAASLPRSGFIHFFSHGLGALAQGVLAGKQKRAGKALFIIALNNRRAALLALR